MLILNHFEKYKIKYPSYDKLELILFQKQKHLYNHRLYLSWKYWTKIETSFFWQIIYRQLHKNISNKMNKLVFIYLLSFIILNINCGKSCNELSPPADGGRRLDVTKCTDADTVKGYDCVVDGTKCVLKSLCELEKDTTKCEEHKELTDNKCVKDGTVCKLVSTATNSSSILNIFKITFILLFIFTIL